LVQLMFVEVVTRGLADVCVVVSLRSPSPEASMVAVSSLFSVNNTWSV